MLTKSRFVFAPLALASGMLAGCNAQCTAACVSFVDVSGDLGLPDAGDRTLSVVACLRDGCPVYEVGIVGGRATCTAPGGAASGHYCSAQMLDSTHVALAIRWFGTTVAVGDSVTVAVTEQPGGVALLDYATTVAVTATYDVCGQQCMAATFDWNAP